LEDRGRHRQIAGAIAAGTVCSDDLAHCPMCTEQRLPPRS
jgi:hypothetical protein